MLKISYDTFGNSASYKDYRNELLGVAEGVELSAYPDTKGIPTIGIGFNLRSNLTAVYDEILGAAAGAGLRNALATTFSQSYATEAALSQAIADTITNWNSTNNTNFDTSFSFADEQGVYNVLNQIDKKYEKGVDNFLAGIPMSEERAVLFSLYYNSPTLLGGGLRKALQGEDRAEAWYEIRYNSNGGGASAAERKGIANRRYLESERFELFNDPTSVGYDEAFNVGLMYTKHRIHINNYEASFSPLTAAANKNEPGIQKVFDELQPAITSVMKKYDIDAKLKFEELLVAYKDHPDINGDGFSYDKKTNDQDLIVGDAKSNKIDAGKGNDAIISLGGADKLTGGEGNDIYILLDTKSDIFELKNGGKDEIIVNSAGLFDVKEVEIFTLGKDVKGAVTLALNDFEKIGLSDQSDKMTIQINKIQSHPIEIKTGKGNDTVKIELVAGVDPSQVLFGNGVTEVFQFKDFAAGDKIDLSSIGIKKLVTSDIDIHVDRGFYLMKPWVNIHVVDNAGNVTFTYYNNTDDWWLTKCGNPTPFGPEFEGTHLSANSFII